MRSFIKQSVKLFLKNQMKCSSKFSNGASVNYSSSSYQSCLPYFRGGHRTGIFTEGICQTELFKTKVIMSKITHQITKQLTLDLVKNIDNFLFDCDGKKVGVSFGNVYGGVFFKFHHLC